MSPFVSESQRRFLWAKHPEIAKRWADEYGTPEDLPPHKKKSARKEAAKRLLNKKGGS